MENVCDTKLVEFNQAINDSQFATQDFVRDTILGEELTNLIKILVSQMNLVSAARAKEIAKKQIQEYNDIINNMKDGKI